MRADNASALRSRRKSLRTSRFARADSPTWVAFFDIANLDFKCAFPMRIVHKSQTATRASVNHLWVREDACWLAPAEWWISEQVRVFCIQFLPPQ